MTEENETHEVLEDTVEQVIAEEPQQDEGQETEKEGTQVPLFALQKERKKRQELEYELQFERRRNEQLLRPQDPAPEDNSKYESATKAELNQSQQEAIRIIEERMWIKNNPEKYEKINEYLPEFLKQRPNLAHAINTSSNRYEEAYTLMDALTPKQKQVLKTSTAKPKDAPNSPLGVPKAQSLNQAVDVMTMSDDDFARWRQQQRRRQVG